ncbi:MAG TPA: tetratricopeptide repeat protein [Nitrospirae bacterium]|nr:tetratricopeptide repeat protein [Nitrospirota bacterium]
MARRPESVIEKIWLIMDKRGIALIRKIKSLLTLIACMTLLGPVQVYAEEDATRAASGGDAPSIELELDINKLSEYRAELGLKNLLPYSMVLLDEGIKAYEAGRKEEAVSLFKGSKELSPDLPSPLFQIAKTNISIYPSKLNKAAGQMLDAWKTFRGNFWWSFQTAGTFFISLFVALHISIFIIILTLIASKFRLYVHDIMEDKRKLYLLAAPALFIFFGPVFGMAGFILPFWIYLNKRERIVMYSAVGFFVSFVLLLPVLSSFVGASSDKTLHDVVKINEGIYSGRVHESAVGDDSNNNVLFSYAIDQRRKGHYEDAIRLYNEILKDGDDPKSLNNIANSYVGLGEYDEALSYYKKALSKTKLASANFNISQLFREVMKFRDAEKYYDAANDIDPEKVAFYSSVKGLSANRFVMDDTLAIDDLWRFAFERSPLYESSKSLGRIRSFSSREFLVFLFILLIAAIFVYQKQVGYGAYCCRRCGGIYCSSCEKRLSHEEVCLTCFKTLVKVSEMGARERIERILEIQRHRDNKNMRLKALTLLFPGAGHIYYGWTLQGTAILVTFAFFLFSALFWSNMPVPEAMNHMASFFLKVSVVGFIIVYSISVISVFRGTPKRWR